MKEKVREIFQSSAGNQRLTIENSHLAIFLSLVAGSSFIEIAYFSWVKFGYLDPLAIVFETSLLFAGFIVITVGLSRKLEKWLKFLWFTAIATLSLQVILYPYPPGLRVYTILFLAGLFITGLTYVVLEIRRGILQKILCFYSLEIIIFLIIFTIFVGFYYTRYFPSDESAIDTYAASLFLKGINPYNPSNMVNTLSIMHFPYYLGTPLLSGGYVQTLGYPVLSFFAYLPTAVFSIKPSFFQESLTAIPVLILLAEYIRKGCLNMVPALFLGIFSSTMILTEGLNGGNGFLWSSLVMLSYIYLSKPVGSGILFGIALSVKQIPIFVLPFFIILMLKERKKSDPVIRIHGNFRNIHVLPVLSFFAYLPTAVFSIKPSFFQESLTAIPVLILLAEYIRKGYLNMVPALFLGIFSSTMILTEGLNGGNGFLWSSLVMLSYIYLSKPVGSGILFGIALSVKQIPIFVLPFFIILVLKERKKSDAGRWFIAVILAFFIINGYFILLNPVYYVKSILNPELLPLLGYGMGISQISFLGYVEIPEVVFTVIMICSMFILIIVYTLYFDLLKYALFVFPMVIMAFNYRVAIEYFLYWVILCFSTIPFLAKERMDRKHMDIPEIPMNTDNRIHSSKRPDGKKVAVVAVVLLCVIPVCTAFYHSNTNSRIIIESSVPQPIYNNRTYADSMNITVYFSSAATKPMDIFFRIVEPGVISNGNGLIWNISGNSSEIKPDTNSTFMLHTDIPAEYLNLSESYRVVVYCSGMVSARTFSTAQIEENY